MMGIQIRFIDIWFRKIISLFVLFMFCVANSCVYAVPDNVEGVLGFYTKKQAVKLDVNKFILSPELGIVKHVNKGTSDKLVIHIQDAHCNENAQLKISNIIESINKEYGIDCLNLEGGVGAYDLSVFNGLEGREIRERTADYFLKWGRISAGEYFAIKNPDKIKLWGIEDTLLYLDNLKIYRESLEYKDRVDHSLEQLELILQKLKISIYNVELMEIDRSYREYKTGKLSFKKYLEFLLKKGESKIKDIKLYPNICFLEKAMEAERKIDFKKANSQRDQLIDDMEQVLSVKEFQDLARVTLAFHDETISQLTYYEYLGKKASQTGYSLEGVPELQKYISYIEVYESVDKMAVMKELDEMEKEIKDTLFTNYKQRKLDILSKHQVLMENIFDLKLSREDYMYYKENIEAFEMSNFMSFIEKEAEINNVTFNPEPEINNLDSYRKKIAKFYEYSFERDKVFLKNMEFSEGETKAAIVVTGGFHTENLLNILKEKDISYISIMPSFRNEKGYISPYFDILGGQGASPAEKGMQTIFFTMQVPSMLNSLGVDVSGLEDKTIFDMAVVAVSASFEAKSPVAVLVEGGDNDGKYLVTGVTDSKAGQIAPQIMSKDELDNLLFKVEVLEETLDVDNVMQGLSAIAQDRVIKNAKDGSQRKYITADNEIVKGIKNRIKEMEDFDPENPNINIFRNTLDRLLEPVKYDGDKTGLSGVQIVSSLKASHMGGQGMYIAAADVFNWSETEDFDSDDLTLENLNADQTRKLTGLIVHELVAGIFESDGKAGTSHELAEKLQETFESSEFSPARASGLLKNAVRHNVSGEDKTMLDMSQDERNSLVNRDYAAFFNVAREALSLTAGGVQKGINAAVRGIEETLNPEEEKVLYFNSINILKTIFGNDKNYNYIKNFIKQIDKQTNKGTMATDTRQKMISLSSLTDYILEDAVERGDNETLLKNRLNEVMYILLEDLFYEKDVPPQETRQKVMAQRILTRMNMRVDNAKKVFENLIENGVSGKNSIGIVKMLLKNANFDFFQAFEFLSIIPLTNDFKDELRRRTLELIAMKYGEYLDSIKGFSEASSEKMLEFMEQQKIIAMRELNMDIVFPKVASIPENKSIQVAAKVDKPVASREKGSEEDQDRTDDYKIEPLTLNGRIQTTMSKYRGEWWDIGADGTLLWSLSKISDNAQPKLIRGKAVLIGVDDAQEKGYGYEILDDSMHILVRRTFDNTSDKKNRETLIKIIESIYNHLELAEMRGKFKTGENVTISRGGILELSDVAQDKEGGNAYKLGQYRVRIKWGIGMGEQSTTYSADKQRRTITINVNQDKTLDVFYAIEKQIEAIKEMARKQAQRRKTGIGNIKSKTGETLQDLSQMIIIDDGEYLTIESKEGAAPSDTLDYPIAVKLSGREESPDAIVLKLKKYLDNSRTNALSDAEMLKLQNILNSLYDGSISRVVVLEDHPDLLGLFHDGALYLNKDLMQNELGLLHELGESGIELPAGYEGLTRHTFMRGVGKDVRVAYEKVYARAGKSIENLDADTLIAFMQKEMTEDGLREISSSEKALINYNFNEVMGSVNNINMGSSDMLEGLQGRLDPAGNAELTKNVGERISELRKGGLNIILIPNPNIMTMSEQERLGQKTARSFRKKGINTLVMHYDPSDPQESIDKALEEAMDKNNENKYPKIYIYSLIEAGQDIDENIQRAQEENPAIVILGKDVLSSDVSLDDVQVAEVPVISVASVFVNDKRLMENYGYTAEDLEAMRREQLLFLRNSGIFKGVENTDFEKMGAAELQEFMQKIFSGVISVRITKVNWNEIEAWQESQEEVYRSL